MRLIDKKHFPEIYRPLKLLKVKGLAWSGSQENLIKVVSGLRNQRDSRDIYISVWNYLRNSGVLK